ncbi:MAG: hypothetical protein ABIN00_08210 [candidate division WOR-3 bacterium]
MKIKAILSRTTTDKIKSKLLSDELAELVFDCYLKPEEFAEIIRKYYQKEFVIEIKDE